MRLLLAAFFVSGSLIAGRAVVSSAFGDQFDPARVGSGIVLLAFMLCGLAMLVFNRGAPGGDPEQYVRELESQGLLTTTAFKAVRAFEVEEFEDEGLHYFLELEDGSVLYLTGQELYDYTETDDDLETPLPRRFPCTEFTVKRHREKHFIVDLICGGESLEPEVTAPPFTERDYERDLVPDDGEIIVEETYDQIKQRLLNRSRR